MADATYSAEYFRQWYGARPPEFYAPILCQILTFGLPGRLVDLGAGTGLLTELAHRWGIDSVGLEASPEAIRQALDRSPTLPIRQFDLAAPLPFEAGSLENVVLNQVIEHLDPRTAGLVLRECYRVLCPRGRVFVYSPSRRNRYERDSDPTHVHLLLPSELDRALEEIGFRVIHRPNNGLWFLPRSRVANAASRVLLRVLPHEWLSASANAIGMKPSAAAAP